MCRFNIYRGGTVKSARFDFMEIIYLTPQML